MWRMKLESKYDDARNVQQSPSEGNQTHIHTLYFQRCGEKEDDERREGMSKGQWTRMMNSPNSEMALSIAIAQRLCSRATQSHEHRRLLLAVIWH